MILKFYELCLYVDGTPTSEVTPVTIRYIRPPHNSHTSQYHCHEWMTHTLFVPCQLAVPFLRWGYFRLWPWNSKVKLMGVVKGQSYTVGPVSYSFSFHINQTNNSWDTAISKFDLETSKVKVMSDVKGQGHISSPVSNQCTSFTFHINRTNHSWDMDKIVFDLEQGKSEGFESCDRPIVRKRLIWVKIGDVLSRVTLKFDGWPWKSIGNLFFAVSSCATFHSHRWIQAGVTVRKCPILVKIIDFFSRVTLQFDVWPWKKIGHLFYATSSFVHHFVAIGDFKLELQSGNAQFWSNSTIFRAVWPWNLTDDLQKQ